MNLLGLQAAVAAHEDVDVLVLALGAREQLEPHRDKRGTLDGDLASNVCDQDE